MTMTVPRLFRSEQDAAEDRRRAQREHARRQLRCGACGRFARRPLLYGSICPRCVAVDQRPAIRQKVDQAKRWWAAKR